MKVFAAWGALAFGGIGVFSLIATADEPAPQRTEPAAVEVASIDGAEIFTREWIPGDKRSHGGDGLGPVFNDSSCVACHNQGGAGGGGPESKNVDIVTAFHAPMQQQGRRQMNVPMTLPGIVFQSVFGNLDRVPAQQATEEASSDDPDADGEEQTPAQVSAARQKRQAELQKKLREKERERLVKMHPGFAHANSIVLHKDGTFAGYQTWRNQVGGFQFGGGFAQQAGSSEIFISDIAVAEEGGIEIAAVPGGAGRPNNGNMLMAQLKQEVQMSHMRGFNTSMRSGNFVITKSQRNTTALFGAGLIDSIPAETLEELEAAQKKNRLISGRVARLKNGSAGRFGWKAQKSGLADFVLTACAVEVGLNVPDHPQAGHPKDPKYVPAGLDLNQAQCNALIKYVGNLPAPPQRDFANETDKKYIEGGHALFAKVGCADCHVEKVGEVAGIFSDLLLHDMGSELGDTGSYDVFIPNSTPDGEILQLTGQPGQPQKKITGATRQEWRTPPLWGVRDSTPYLHDGRAQTLAQAIAMHGGEANTATHKYFALTDAERFQVKSFLKSLIAPTQEVASR